MDIVKLIKDVIEPLVDNKEGVIIKKMPTDEESEDLYLVVADSKDIAKLIGKGGNVANSMREIVHIAGKLNNRVIRVKFEAFQESELD